MAKITVTFDVDDELIKNISEQSALEDAITSELGWVEQSGLHLESWAFEEEAKKLYSLCEEYQNEDGIREFSILGVSEDRELLRAALDRFVKEDIFGYIAEKGVFESSPDFFQTNSEDGFVEYSIDEIPIVKDLKDIFKDENQSLDTLIQAAENQKKVSDIGEKTLDKRMDR